MIYLYYVGVNTNESLFNFIVSQKNRTKKRIREKLYYGGTFEQYLSELLPDAVNITLTLTLN